MAHETWMVGEPTVIDLELVRSLKVSLAGGQIDVIAHDEPGARVEVHSVSGQDLAVTLDGDALTVDHPQIPWGSFLDTFRALDGRVRGRAEVSLLVPRAVALRFGVVSASALISGLHHDAIVSSVTGDVVLDGIVGELQLNTVNGELSVRDHHGDLRVHTVTGDVTATGEVHRFFCDGVSGDVVLDLHGTPTRIETNSVSGDLTLRLDADLPTRYTISTLNGALQLDDEHVRGVRGSYTGSYGESTEATGPVVDVRARSVSGNVSVVHTERVTS